MNTSKCRGVTPRWGWHTAGCVQWDHVCGHVAKYTVCMCVTTHVQCRVCHHMCAQCSVYRVCTVQHVSHHEYACVASHVCTVCMYVIMCAHRSVGPITCVQSVHVSSHVCTVQVCECECHHVLHNAECVSLITCVHCAVCGCVPARVSTMQSVHVSPITCVHRVFECHMCVVGSAGDICPGATAETPAGRGLGGTLQAAPEPPTPQTGSGSWSRGSLIAKLGEETEPGASQLRAGGGSSPAPGTPHPV